MDRSAGNSSSSSSSGSDSSLVRLKQCELCSSPACLYCASDEAHLCWLCDARIHAANFLVARHPRAFLCSSCGHPSQLSSTGPRLQPRLYLCQRCCCRAEEDGIWNQLDEESKVDCTEIADEASIDERDSSQKASGVMGGNSRVASKIRGACAANCRIEGVGDSEEDDYRHYIGCDGGDSRSSQEATRYKRRKLVGLNHPLRTV